LLNLVLVHIQNTVEYVDFKANAKHAMEKRPRTFKLTKINVSTICTTNINMHFSLTTMIHL